MEILRLVAAVLLPPLSVPAGGNWQALLDKHPSDDPRLYTRHRPRCMGHSEILTIYQTNETLG